MALEYTEEQLNNFDKNTLVQLFLVQQSQLKEINTKLQLLLAGCRIEPKTFWEIIRKTRG